MKEANWNVNQKQEEKVKLRIIYVIKPENYVTR